MQTMLNNIMNYFESRSYHFLEIFYLTFVAIIILFSADIFNPYYSFTNISDSMNPSINRGSITIVKQFSDYKLSDAIAYYAQIDGRTQIITHRITGIGGNVYTTKGDANDVSDRELVKPRLVIGKVILIIPYLGYVITFAKGLIGTWLLIIIPAILIVISEILKIAVEIKRNQST